MRPLWHRLQEGGLGEVVAAEMLQGVVDVQHDAVDFLAEDHPLDWRGLPEHNDLRWPRAVALIEILEIDGNAPVRDVPTRTHFSYGFSEAPRISGDARSISLVSGTRAGWFLDWRCERVGPHSAMLGFRLRSPAEIGFTPRIVEVASVPGSLARREDEDGRGLAFLGDYETIIDGEAQYPVISEAMKNIHFITLLVR